MTCEFYLADRIGLDESVSMYNRYDHIQYFYIKLHTHDLLLDVIVHCY